MKSLDLFKKKDTLNIGNEKRAVDLKELEIYSGMRVMVETPKGELLFIGDLLEPYRGTAELCQYSDGEIVLEEDTIPVTDRMQVKLRGYNNRKRKAVFMEGFLTSVDKHVWRLEELTVTRIENERTFYRLNTDADAVIAVEAEDGTMEERTCRLLNISVGGVSISSEYRYHKGDRFLLKVKLLEKGREAVLYCEVLRIAEKSRHVFEYGCQFLELTRADPEQIAQVISAIGKKEKEKLCHSTEEEL